MPYIYCITNKLNGKKYIGKTIESVTKRFKEHCSEAHNNRFKNRPLYRAMRKYGIENFSIEQLIECEEKYLESYEIMFIDKYNTYHNGYNAIRGGDGKLLFNYIDIITLYQSGLNVKEVSIRVGCITDTVIKVLNIYNIPRHSWNSVRRGLSTPKAVQQLSKDGKFLRTFESCSGAARYIAQLKNIPFSKGMSSKIANCAKGRAHTSYGYRWIWKEE